MESWLYLENLYFQFSPKEEETVALKVKEPSPEQAEVIKITTPDLDETISLVVRKPSIKDKPPETKQENRGKRNWSALRKSISQVRWIFTY